jgi:hypothetical protein
MLFIGTPWPEAGDHSNNTSNKLTMPKAAVIVGSDHIGARPSPADRFASIPGNTLKGRTVCCRSGRRGDHAVCHVVAEEEVVF